MYIKQAYTDRPQLVTSFGELLFANPVSQIKADSFRTKWPRCILRSATRI
ncbi:hypothetical protein ACFQY3_04000 [Paenibacillus farraposensis]